MFWKLAWQNWHFCFVLNNFNIMTPFQILLPWQEIYYYAYEQSTIFSHIFLAFLFSVNMCAWKFNKTQTNWDNITVSRFFLSLVFCMNQQWLQLWFILYYIFILIPPKFCTLLFPFVLPIKILISLLQLILCFHSTRVVNHCR